MFTLAASLFTFVGPTESLFTFVGPPGSTAVKPVELVDGSGGNGTELASVGVEALTWTVGFGGRPSFGREAT